MTNRHLEDLSTKERLDVFNGITPACIACKWKVLMIGAGGYFKCMNPLNFEEGEGIVPSQPRDIKNRLSSCIYYEWERR